MSQADRPTKLCKLTLREASKRGNAAAVLVLEALLKKELTSLREEEVRNTHIERVELPMALFGTGLNNKNKEDFLSAFVHA